MIICMQSTSGTFSCDNCNRKLPIMLVYQFENKKKEIFEIKAFCEDCSNALTNLHCKVIVSGVDHKYDLDEISEVNDALEHIALNK